MASLLMRRGGWMARNTVFQLRNGGGRESSRWSGGVSELKSALSTRSATGTSSLSGDVVDQPSALGSRDGYFEKSLLPRGDANRREFTYFVLGAGRFLYASAARLILIRFIASMSASDDVLAMANTEVDISNISKGQGITIKWRGKPVFIRRRTQEEIDQEGAVPMNLLRDEEEDIDRVINPEWLVVLGICTHLGCVPISNAGEYRGWFCPCHGSHYDLSGRIRKGPAPLNMEVPPYSFMPGDDTKLIVG